MPKHRMIHLAIGVLFLLNLLDHDRSWGDDWTQWRGPTRSGAASQSPQLRDNLPLGGLSPAWISEENFAAGGGWSSPIVAEGRVFLYTHRQQLKEGMKPPPAQYPSLSDDKKAGMSPLEFDAYEELRIEEQMTRLKDFFSCTDDIHCLDAGTGTTLWKHARASGPTRWRQSSTPVFDSGRLFYLGADRAMVCLDADDGNVQWVSPLPFQPENDEPTVSSPVVVDGKIVVSAGRLLAYDSQTGNVAWQGDLETTRGIYSSPTVWNATDGRYVIAHVAKGKTICVDPRTGHIRWSVVTFSDRSSPTVIGDRLITYGGSRKGGLRCFQLSMNGAEQLWINQRLSDAGSSPTVVDGLVFVQGDHKLACLDLVSGETCWTEPIDATDSRYTSPAGADGKVFFAAEGLLCFRAIKEQMTSLFDACVLVDSRLVSKAEVRSRLNIDALDQSSDGQMQAQQRWHKEVINPGPLRCVTPALAEGKLYLRTSSRVVCYDLTVQ